MIKKLAVIALLCSWFMVCHAQEYQVGSSVLSIEPDSTIYSVALAGYGAPREGRFSLTWKLVDDVPDGSALAALNGKLYLAGNDGKLHEGTFKGDKLKWRNIENKLIIKSLTNWNGNLLAAAGGELYKGVLSDEQVAWTSLGKAANITGITALNNRLYAANSSNKLLTGSVTAGKLTWKNTGKAYRIAGMANDNRRLYYVNTGDTLWFSKPGQSYQQWREIGRHNSFTFNIHVKQIVVLNGLLYALSKDNNLYLARHSTKGDLSVRTLAIKQGNKTVVVATLDVTGFNATFTDDIKKELYKKYKLPAASIVINASHTHFAPVAQAWRAWGDFYHTPDSLYLNHLLKPAIIRSVGLALQDLSKSKLYFGRGETYIGENRRGVNNLLKPYDPTLDVVKVDRDKGNITLFSAGCHPVFNNAEANSTFTLSANYPGVAKRLVQEKTGTKAFFIQGFGGDVNPAKQNYEETGTDLARDVFTVLKNNMKEITGGISYTIDTVNIPITPWSLEKVKAFRAENVIAVAEEKKVTAPYSAEGQFALTQLLEREKNVRWADIMLENYKQHKVAKVMPVYVQVINIGNWKLVCLSREVTNEYAAAIRAFWPDKMVTVAGYCNDVPSYLPRDWHIHDATYEGYDSFFWYGQPAVPPSNIRDIVLNGIKQLHR